MADSPNRINARPLSPLGCVGPVKAHDKLARRGVVVPQRTLHRYALEVLGVGRSARTTTLRVADGEPG